ncbi:MAG: putative damage-inducible protein DinB [Cellvibrionaceae bacterium]|jgi:uncharacterized damage-inducible protein DinB
MSVAADRYIKSLQFHDHVIKGKTEGVTHEQSLLQLSFPSNCMNWNLGHLLVYRHQYLGWLDGVSKPDEAEFAVYGAGSEQMVDGTHAMQLAEILERLNAVSADIVTALEAAPAEKFDAIFDAEAGTTIDDRLRFYVMFHEAYHIGQLEPLFELAKA